MFVGGQREATPEIPEKILQWRMKRNLVEKEIVSGVLGSGATLPSLKELQARYGVCYDTMKKIMRSLSADGVVKPRGKGYAPAFVQPGGMLRRIVFVTMAGHFSQRSSINQEHNRIVTLFENECNRAGLHLEIMEIDFFDSSACRRAAAKLKADSHTLGFLLDVWWYESKEFRQNYLDVLSRLAGLKNPVAVLDEIGNFDLPLPLTRNPLLQVFTVESEQAGGRIARFLLGLGHTSIAFISLFHYAHWARRRYDGIVSQYSRLGFGGGVKLFAETVDVYLPNLLTASGLSDDTVRGLIAIGRTPSQFRDMESHWIEFKKANKPPFKGFPRLDTATVDGLVEVLALMRRHHGHHFYERTAAGSFDAIEKVMFTMHLTPLLDQAYKIGGATAWVCATDGIAFEALSFLRERKIRVPHDISVAGFDNAPVTAIEQGLTTLDFNAMSFVHQMLGFIVRPPRPRGAYRHATVEIEGVVMERATTGKAYRATRA
jgi:DNA-binding LacI/PurR family transcriptional regulator